MQQHAVCGKQSYSITSCAHASSIGGTLEPKRFGGLDVEGFTTEQRGNREAIILPI